MKKLILLIPALLLIPLLHYSARAEVTVSATLSPVSIQLNQAGQFSITVDGAQSADIEVPDTKGYDIIYRGQNSRVNFVNGKYSSSLTATYSIHPQETGKFTLPAIAISAGGKDLQTEPIDFEVTDTPSAASPQSTKGKSGTQPATTGNTPFMTIEGLEEAHYVGEIVPITIKAYFPRSIRISQISYPRMKGEGCVIPQLKEDPVQQQEVVDGTAYTILSWQTELSPVKEGTHPLHLEMDAVQIIPQKRTSTSLFGSPSPFGNDLFDDFFGNVRKKQIRVASEPQTLHATPLPQEGRPANYTGAVGEFSITTEVTPTKAEVGEPLTLTIIVEGTGSTEGIEPPTFPDDPDWKTYSPAPVSDKSSRNRKVFDQAIVAQSPGVTEIPALDFSFFNPVSGEYTTVSSSPLPLTITGVERAPAPVVAQEVPPKEPVVSEQQGSNPDLAPLHFRTEKPVPDIVPLFLRTAYLTFSVLFVVLIVIALIIRRRRQTPLSAEEKIQKRRSFALRSVDELEKRADAIPVEQCGIELRNLIRTHLGHLWGCPPDSITVRDMQARIGDSENLLVEIFNTLEGAAYGGSQPDRDTMRGYLKQVRTSLEDVL